MFRFSAFNLVPVSVWSIVSWATILLPAELIYLLEEANRSRSKRLFYNFSETTQPSWWGFLNDNTVK